MPSNEPEQVCGNVECDYFATDHAAEHPCGQRGERPGEPCRYCGREVIVGEDACPNCWVSVVGIEREVAASIRRGED